MREEMSCPKCGCNEIGSAGYTPVDLNPKHGYCELVAECVQDECNGALKILVSGSTQIAEETRWPERLFDVEESA